jgi:hypothetical protein
MTEQPMEENPNMDPDVEPVSEPDVTGEPDTEVDPSSDAVAAEED